VLDNHDQDLAVSFGPFRLLPKSRRLEKDGAPLHIGGRALDILIFLAERAGEVVDKRELVKRVWADVNVDDGSLRFHITALRKTLGETGERSRYVVNVPGRGYCFAAPLARPTSSDAQPATHVSSLRSLPAPLTRMIGRDDAVEKISTELSLHRFVTVVGPGGIGKTSVALAVAHRQLPVFEGQVCFVDFGALADAKLVPGTIAAALGLTVNTDDPMPGLLTFLREQRMLLIFDSCEHILDDLAPLAERIVK
jgi:DNA-binding winged helix-turn-helix (wHTH) protein